MRGHCEEPRLGAVGSVGLVAGLAERALGLGAVGDVAADALHLGGAAGIVAGQPFAPCDPSRSERTGDLLVMDAGAASLKRGAALLKHVKGEAAADQRVAR